MNIFHYFSAVSISLLDFIENMIWHNCWKKEKKNERKTVKQVASFCPLSTSLFCSVAYSVPNYS